MIYLFRGTKMSFKIKHGDSLEVLKLIPDNYVDSLVTDPPAGISFMNLEFDSDKGGRDQWIAWLASIMAEAFRVMKPGAHGLVWGLPKTDHWTATALENVGFEIREKIMHLFGTGFPKSSNIFKQLQKEGYKDEDIKQYEGLGSALKPAYETWILIRKPISERTIAANVLKHGTGGINIDASRINPGELIPGGGNGQAHKGGQYGGETNGERPIVEAHSNGRFPANLLLSHSADCVEVGTKKVKGTGEVTQGGKTRFTQDGANYDRNTKHPGFANADGTETVAAWECVEGCPVKVLDEQSGPCKSGGASTGRGFQDDFVGGKVVSKVEQAYTKDGGNGASRFFKTFPGKDKPNFIYQAKASKRDKNNNVENLLTWEEQDRNLQDLMVSLNELLKDMSENTMLSQSDTEWNMLWFGKPQMDQYLKDTKYIIQTALKTITESKTWNALVPLSISGSIQAAIRMIEMNGLNLVEVAENTRKFLQTTTNEKTDIVTNASLALLQGLKEVRRLAKKGNIHSTVKSQALMSYLINLVTPPNGIVLDPFMGSGSTGVAAVRDGFKFIGIEKEEEYFNISKSRIEGVTKPADSVSIDGNNENK